MASLTYAEQETVITWSRASDEAVIYTHDRGLIALLEKRGFKATLQNVHAGRVIAKSFEVPKAWISVRPPRKASAAMRAALTKARAAQSGASGPAPVEGPARSIRSTRAAESQVAGVGAGSPPSSTGRAAK